VAEHETKQEKAQRLINEGRVARLAEGQYAVAGDTGRYLVCIPERAKAERSNVPVASCTCEHGRTARGVCSHVLAGNAVEKHVREGNTYAVSELPRA
jgi:hypothetical protein